MSANNTDLKKFKEQIKDMDSDEKQLAMDNYVFNNTDKPVISLRKWHFLNGFMYSLLALQFLVMAVANHIKLFNGHSVFPYVFYFFGLCEIVYLVFYIKIKSKYKKDREDELSVQMKYKASHYAFNVIFAVLFVIIPFFCIFLFDTEFKFSLQSYIFISAFFENLKIALTSFIFIHLDRKFTED